MHITILFGHLPEGKYGETLYGEDWSVIQIDLCKPVNPAQTYLHELIHIKHPDWSETKVRKAETRIWKKLTQQERFGLYKELFNRSYYPIDEYVE